MKIDRDTRKGKLQWWWFWNKRKFFQLLYSDEISGCYGFVLLRFLKVQWYMTFINFGIEIKIINYNLFKLTPIKNWACFLEIRFHKLSLTLGKSTR